ncbi:MAG: DUF4130 domain-containing protein [Flavobacteriaceae bacterium]
MELGKTLQYDGSFNGFLTAVYLAVDKHWNVVAINKNANDSTELFIHTEYVRTDPSLAKRVWNSIGQKNSLAIKRIYFSFLSEYPNIEVSLYRYILWLVDRNTKEYLVEIPQATELLNTLAAKVEKEKRRMEIFAQFQLAKEHSNSVNLKPKYNVLPLLSKHLREAEKGKHWQIYDERRNYGIAYADGSLQLISSDTSTRLAV